MTDVWRICVVMGDQALNQNLINSLRKDGYAVKGALSSADAMRMLWSEEYDIVICDLSLPSGDGLELLRWLRAYRSNVRAIVLGRTSSTGDSDQRSQALEIGATSYLEKPVDVRQIKDELRNLLQQTGFSASLDSFDLLDVIQIINLTRKSITLLVNTGLEEHGVLRFHNGDLAWAEYGILRGEEAFFALAAHKNGTVTQQISNDPLVLNVTQPLSRLIFQALQYRSKYADKQTSEHLPVSPPSLVQSQGLAGNSLSVSSFSDQEIDDSPFLFSDDQIISSSVPQVSPDANVSPAISTSQNASVQSSQFELTASPNEPERENPWWESAEEVPNAGRSESRQLEHVGNFSTSELDLNSVRQAPNTSQLAPMQESYVEPEQASAQYPSWLVEQPTSAQVVYRGAMNFPVFDLPSDGTLSQPISDEMQQIKGIPLGKASFKTTNDLVGGGTRTGAGPVPTTHMQAFAPEGEERHSSSVHRSLTGPQKLSALQSSRSISQSGVFDHVPASSNPKEVPLNSSTELQMGSAFASSGRVPAVSRESRSATSSSSPNNQWPVARKNALVSALQTLGYSIPGFLAAAVLDIESSPVAQVAIDDADLSQTWRLLSIVQRSVLDALQANDLGNYEETIMTTSSRHVLIRSVGPDKKAFFVLITSKDANCADSLGVMTNVEGAIIAALYQ